MTVYVGSSKIGKINNGSTAIGKVYNGSSLVFQSGPSLKLYGMTFQMNNQTFDAYLVGSWSTSGLISTLGNGRPIRKITGTLGQSGSKVYYSVGDDTDEIYDTYYKTTTLDGLKIYEYGEVGNNFNFFSLWVLEGSKVGSIALLSMSNCHKPSSVNSTTCVGGGYTYTRKASTDATWSLTGVK